MLVLALLVGAAPGPARGQDAETARVPAVPGLRADTSVRPSRGGAAGPAASGGIPLPGALSPRVRPHRRTGGLPAPDPAGAARTPQQDTARRPPVSPLGAFGRSLILPGWGQVAADRPGRGAFYFSMEALSAFMVLKTQAKLSAARRGLPADTGLVEARKRQREDWIALSVFWALASGVDAWISAQFWGYEGKVSPPEEGTRGAAIRIEVPLSGR